MLDDADTGVSATESDAEHGGRGTEPDGWRSDNRREPDHDEQRTSEDVRHSVTAADVDSNWWCWPATTAGLTGFSILVGIAIAVAFLTGVLSVGVSLLFVFVLLLAVLAIVGYGSILAIHFDANAIRETEANWHPSVIGYMVAAVLISPLIPAIVYVVQRHRHLGEP